MGDNRSTGYTVDEANSGFAALNAANNVNNTATVAGITPTAGGEITISIAPTANNNNANHFTYLGVLRLSAYVPPLQFLPPTLTSGKIRLEWTGTGQLLRAPAISGPWTPVTPAPSSPFRRSDCARRKPLLPAATITAAGNVRLALPAHEDRFVGFRGREDANPPELLKPHP